jgi:hypothetical protein
VYVAPADLDAFVASFIATFGGHASKPVVSTVTPTPSSTQFQYIISPVGTISTFAYTTPIPYPFGLERTGHLVTDPNQALAAVAQRAPASWSNHSRIPSAWMPSLTPERRPGHTYHIPFCVAARARVPVPS